MIWEGKFISVGEILYYCSDDRFEEAYKEINTLGILAELK